MMIPWGNHQVAVKAKEKEKARKHVTTAESQDTFHENAHTQEKTKVKAKAKMAMCLPDVGTHGTQDLSHVSGDNIVLATKRAKEKAAKATAMQEKAAKAV